MTETTPNYAFILPDFNVVTWHDEVNGNFEKIDSLLKTATGLPSVKGAWANSTAYVVHDRVLDPVDISLWEAQVDHTSRASGDMIDDRTDHPTYWKAISTGWTGRGEWANSTLYVVGDVAYDSSDYLFAVCILQHTSPASGSLRDDLSGHWTVIFDGKPAVTDAVAAKDAAETAQAAAELAETNAETAETNAAASAAASAASAVTSAQNNAYFAQYTFSTLTSYPPSSGEVRLNNATQNLATLVYISHFNALGIDLKNQIPLSIGIGSKLLLQDRATIGKFMIYDVIGDPVLSDSDYQVPVVIATAGTALTALPIMLGMSGGGGAAAVTTDDNPPAAPLRDGQLWFKSSTGVFYIYYDDGTSKQWVQISAAPQIQATNQRTRGHIDPGFNLANDTTDATNDIVFPTGVVASDVAPYPLMLHTQTIRQLDVNFDVNNGDRLGGKFFSAALTNTTYHEFVISNGTLVKSGFSPNLNPTGDDLYPAGYTHYRRVASWLREGGVLVPLLQRGNIFKRISPSTIRNSASTTVATPLGMTVPTGIITQPIFSAALSVGVNSDAFMSFGDGDSGNANAINRATSSATAGDLGTCRDYIAGGFLTDTSGRLMFAQTASSGTITNGQVFGYGWIDARGTE